MTPNEKRALIITVGILAGIGILILSLFAVPHEFWLYIGDILSNVGHAIDAWLTKYQVTIIAVALGTGATVMIGGMIWDMVTYCLNKKNPEGKIRNGKD